MNPVSPTAKGVAYLRAIEEEVSRDTLAKHFTDEEGKRLIKKWLSIAPYTARVVAIRGRYIEDLIVEEMKSKGITQALNIAAGLNTFPYRHLGAQNLSHYAELDLAPMLEYKQQQVEAFISKGLIAKPTFDIQYIPTDLASESFLEDFKKIEWNWEKPSIYIFEGISYYIPMERLKEIIDTFAETMTKGSILIMDYFPDISKKNEDLVTIMDDMPKDGGETCVTYLSKSEINNLLEHFNIISDRLENDLEKTYYGECTSKPLRSILIAEKRS